MREEDRQICEAILSSGREVGRLLLVKVIRDGSLLMALPLNRGLAIDTLNLYQPQSWKGRLFRSVLKILVALGVYRLLPRFELTLGDSGLVSDLSHDVASGGFGFLLGNAASPLRNLIGVFKSNGASWVVKAGCGDAADVVRDEYKSMRAFSGLVAGVPKCGHVFDIENGTAYTAELVRGKSPRGADDDTRIFTLLESWLQKGHVKPVSKLDVWKAMDATLDDDERRCFSALTECPVLCPVMHGDFAPWNIKIDASGKVMVLDWECASPAGMPGWDWLHYQVQRMILVEGSPAGEIVKRCDALLRSGPMQAYLKKAGVGDHENLLLGSYLYYSGRVHDYPREDLIKAWKLVETTQA